MAKMFEMKQKQSNGTYETCYPVTTVEAVEGAAASIHTHTKSQISDFPISLPASDVSAWAKSATKPSYTASEVNALPIAGGTITGGLRLKGTGNYGNKLNFGDGEYVYLSEPTDDSLKVFASGGINLQADEGNLIAAQGYEILTRTTLSMGTILNSLSSTGAKYFTIKMSDDVIFKIAFGRVSMKTVRTLTPAFGISYLERPSVMITGINDHDMGMDQGKSLCYVSDITTSGFTVKVSTIGTNERVLYVNWIAIGR